jgi:hypothetical protein
MKPYFNGGWPTLRMGWRAGISQSLSINGGITAEGVARFCERLSWPLPPSRNNLSLVATVYDCVANICVEGAFFGRWVLFIHLDII